MLGQNENCLLSKGKRALVSQRLRVVALFATLCFVNVPGAFSQALPGGTLDPNSIPKYVTPLVIPPVMNDRKPGNGKQDKYNIAVRQFKQQILPGGIWNSINGRADMFPPTTVWSYGPKKDKVPAVAPDPNSQFNYPAYTFETKANKSVRVKWINDLVDKYGKFLPHLLPVDQTVHWANPLKVCVDDSVRTDCKGKDPTPYTGPVPIITHVHGAHVKPDSDGYPEAWYLPKAKNIPSDYARSGTLFDDITGTNFGDKGFADFRYQNTQPATTLWYHDHTLGMTRLNVYAGPAGFWLIRGGEYDLKYGLPGPAPITGQGVLDLNVPGNPVRNEIREIPIVIQDRSFNEDGSLFYQFDRAFFEGLGEGQEVSPNNIPPNDDLQIPFAPDSDVLPIWNPEAFFNVMVVNGVSWPSLDVANALYRFRLLNGANSRFLNLALFVVENPGEVNETLGQEIPFYQIGAEQGFLPNVVKVSTGFATTLPGGGTVPADVPAFDPDQALLMGLAERADVLVDFRGLPDGTVIQMTNTAPDAPFGGFGDPPADPDTTGQVMRFVVDSGLNGNSDTDPGRPQEAQSPYDLILPVEASLTGPYGEQQVSLNELESEVVCVEVDADENYVLVAGKVQAVDCDDTPGDGNSIVPFGPTEALLGLVDASGNGIPLKWTDPSGVDIPINLNNGGLVTVNVTENPSLGAKENWDISNFTADAHPIHLHLVRFQVVDRECIPGHPDCTIANVVQPWESGFKDTVISYPGEITTIRAKFDIEGLYVWHCHIVEHEDNEMMRPFIVGGTPLPGNRVTGFRLYDADADMVIPPDPLTDGAMLDIAGENVNFEAVTASPDNGTESVFLELFGPTSTSRSERLAPYLLAGDNAGGGDIFPITLLPGVYTLKATPYTEDFGGGTAGIPVEIQFTVKDTGNNNEVVGFVLYNASTNAQVPGFVLNGLTDVDLSAHCSGSVAGCNIRAVVAGSEGGTQSVRLNLDGGPIPPGPFRNENSAPYFLGGDTAGDVFTLPLGQPYIGPGLIPGSHTVNATPYSGNNGGGSKGPAASVTFNVVN